jgi:hypothetical protein
MTLTTKNRRSDARVNVPLVVRFRHLGIHENSKWDMSLVENISKSGFFFHSTFRFQKGQELEVKLHNPYTGSVDHCTCSVVRSIPVKEHYLFCETAVALKEIFNEDLRAYNAFMDHALVAA